MEVISAYVAVQSQCCCERLYSVIGRYDICECCREPLVKTQTVPCTVRRGRPCTQPISFVFLMKFVVDNIFFGFSHHPVSLIWRQYRTRLVGVAYVLGSYYKVRSVRSMRTVQSTGTRTGSRQTAPDRLKSYKVLI